MSMQCLSSTNEAFLSQKTDLIAELKMSKDINGIRKMKVEKAKMEGSYDKEAYVDITKQFTATHFVEAVSKKVSKIAVWMEYMQIWARFHDAIFHFRFLKKTMLATSYQIGSAKCWLKKRPNVQRKTSKSEWLKKLKIDAYHRYRNGNAISWHVVKRPKINSSNLPMLWIDLVVIFHYIESNGFLL